MMPSTWRNQSTFRALIRHEDRRGEPLFREARATLANMVKAFASPASPIGREETTFRFAGDGLSGRAATVDPKAGIWAAVVSGQNWKVDLVLQPTGDALQLVLRCQTRNGQAFPVETGDFLRKRLTAFVARPWSLTHSGVPVGVPLSLRTIVDVEEFERLLIDSSRRMPILLLSETDPSAREYMPGAPAYLLDPEKAAQQSVDALIVAAIGYQAAYDLTDRIGKQWSCYLGAIRLYRPDVDLVSGDPWNHPLILPHRVHAASAERLAAEARQTSANWNVDLWMLDFIDEAIEDPAIQVSHPEPVASAAPPTPSEAEPTVQLDVESLLLRVARLEGELERLRAQVRRVATGEGLATAQVPYPDSLSGVGDWADEHFGGNLVLSGRALRGAKDSRYRDVPLVYRCLEFLATQYRDARMSDESSNEALRAHLEKLGVDLRRSITPTRAGEQGDEYFLRWPTGKDRRWFLEWHLAKGNSRDQADCLRIYFFWDAQREQVVVGWLTSHLDVRIT